MAASGTCCPVRWLVVQADHPALAGHFPGDPIMPGVVLLDSLQALLEDAAPHLMLTGIPVAKFLKPARPGDVLLLGLEPTQPGQCRFVCCIDGDVAARGVFQLGEPA